MSAVRHAGQRASDGAVALELPLHRKVVHRGTGEHVSAEAAHAAYDERFKSFSIDLTGSESSTVSRRLWRGERNITATYVERMPGPVKARALSFDDELRRREASADESGERVAVGTTRRAV